MARGKPFVELNAKIDSKELATVNIKLRDLPVKLQKTIIRQEARKALRTQMLPIARAATPIRGPAKAPFDKLKPPDRKPGMLRRAVAVRSVKSKRGLVGSTLLISDRKFPKSGSKKGQDAFYGAFVEYGHRIGKRSHELNAAQKRAARHATPASKLGRKRGALNPVSDKRASVPGVRMLTKTADKHGKRVADLAARAIAKRVYEAVRR